MRHSSLNRSSRDPHYFFPRNMVKSVLKKIPYTKLKIFFKIFCGQYHQTKLKKVKITLLDVIDLDQIWILKNALSSMKYSSKIQEKTSQRKPT